MYSLTDLTEQSINKPMQSILISERTLQIIYPLLHLLIILCSLSLYTSQFIPHTVLQVIH